MLLAVLNDDANQPNSYYANYQKRNEFLKQLGKK